MSDDRPVDPADEHPVHPDDERPLDDADGDPTLGDDMTVLTSGSDGDGDLVPDEDRPVPFLADEDDDEDDDPGVVPV
jgi:hypothetical protein